ncbi:MAG: amidohydrolase family protein, partial [Gemmatimonadales bacterium]|nr:amidohydrolase family protein [Gemmatimonadales bacterium]
MSDRTKYRRHRVRTLRLLAALTPGIAGGAGAPERVAAQAAMGAAEEPATVLFTNATLVDGTGAPGYVGDLLIEGGRIAALGAPGSVEAPPDAERRDLTGLVLAPGFIDIHNHSTTRLFDFPLAATQLAQGITTIVVGADGSSPWPISDYLGRIDELRPTVDVATLVGHGTVRSLVMDEDFRRTATDAEIADMTVRVERGMTEGAFGLSSGLEYDPGFYSSTGELIALARAAAGHGGFYMTHMRDEEEGLLEAVDEAIRIGREAGLPVQMSHIKAGNASVWGRAPDVLERIRRANEEEELDVTADQYPYAAWQSGLAIVVRSRMFSNPD